MGASAGRKLKLSSGAVACTSILPPLPRLARAGRGGGLELAEAMARAAPSSSLLPPSPSPPSSPMVVAMAEEEDRAGDGSEQ